MFDWIGWIATAVFAASYFCKRPAVLRRYQAAAAVLWIGYGVLINALPVIAANTVVAVLAVASSFRQPESLNQTKQHLDKENNHGEHGDCVDRRSPCSP